MATIKVTKDVEQLLQALKRKHPELGEAEILQRALSDLKQQLELERRREWADSLPELEIPEEEARSIVEARKEVDFVEMSVDDLERYAEAVDED